MSETFLGGSGQTDRSEGKTTTGTLAPGLSPFKPHIKKFLLKFMFSKQFQEVPVSSHFELILANDKYKIALTSDYLIVFF